MIRPSLARKYARALVGAAARRQAVATVVAQVRAPERMAASDPELRAFLQSPAYPEAAKKKILTTIIEHSFGDDAGGVDPLVRNFIEALSLHHRLGDYLDIMAVLAEAEDESAGMVKARITTAAPLSADDQKTLQAALARATSRAVRLETSVDPKLLGGVVTQIGSTIYDGSVRTRLQKMKEHMVKG